MLDKGGNPCTLTGFKSLDHGWVRYDQQPKPNGQKGNYSPGEYTILLPIYAPLVQENIDVAPGLGLIHRDVVYRR